MRVYKRKSSAPAYTPEYVCAHEDNALTCINDRFEVVTLIQGTINIESIKRRDDFLIDYYIELPPEDPEHKFIVMVLL